MIAAHRATIAPSWSLLGLALAMLVPNITRCFDRRSDRSPTAATPGDVPSGA
jgi:hypothetical protein